MNRSTQRYYAALSFMLAGGIPGTCLILYDLAKQGQLGSKLWLLLVLYIIVPGILAAIFGFLIGAPILNPDKVKSRRQAAARGLSVSVAAWLAFAPILTAAAGTSLYLGFLDRLFLILFFGSIIIGSLVAGLGIATGLLLYRLRKPDDTMSWP